MDWKKKMNMALAWMRRHTISVLVGIACALFVFLLLVPGQERSGDYDDFLDALGFRESTDNYALVNRYGYMGRYQMGGPALEEAGFKDEDGWTELAHSYGIYDQADFLNCPEGQDAAVKAYHETVCSYIRYYGLEQYIGTDYCGVRVTRSGLLASCHLVGIGAMIDALDSGEPAYDGNQTPASEYMELFAGYNMDAVWNR